MLMQRNNGPHHSKTQKADSPAAQFAMAIFLFFDWRRITRPPSPIRLAVQSPSTFVTSTSRTERLSRPLASGLVMVTVTSSGCAFGSIIY